MVTSVTFVPLGERVVVKPIEQEQTTKGGIYLPDTAKEKPQEGEVVAVGPGRATDDGSRIPMELGVGDRVIYSKVRRHRVQGRRRRVPDYARERRPSQDFIADL